MHGDKFEVAASGGDYGEFMGRAIVNLPVNDTFAVRFAYQDNSRSGLGSSIANGQDNLQNQHRYTARFGALWQPSDATEAYFTYEHFEANEYGAILHPLTGPAPGTLIAQLGGLFAQLPIPGLPRVSSRRILTRPTAASRIRRCADRCAATHVTQHIDGDLAAKLILGFRRLDATTALDVDASPLPLADTTLFNTSNQKSAELQLSDKALAIASIGSAGSTGSATTAVRPRCTRRPRRQFLAALAALDQRPARTSPPISARWPATRQNTVVNSSDAAYLHGEYHLTSAWAVAAGLRRTEDRREINENDYVIVPGFGHDCRLDINGRPINGPCPDINMVAQFSYWSWELSTHYRLNEAWNAYVRIGRSQRSGGWNAPLGSYNDVPYKPEQLTDYEIGAKATCSAARWCSMATCSTGATTTCSACSACSRAERPTRWSERRPRAGQRRRIRGRTGASRRAPP